MPEMSTQNENRSSSNRAVQYVSDWWQDILDCIAFFTRLPVPSFLGTISEGMPKMKRTARAMPLIGLILAFLALIPATLFNALAMTSPLPSLLLAAMTIASMAIVTGGLHEDGLSDVADGFWGGHTITRKLEIMKDSRLGSYGATALFLSLTMRISIVYYLFENYGVMTGGIAYMAAGVASRVPLMHVWHSLPAARLTGLSAGLGCPSTTSYGISIAMGALATALMIVPNFGLAAGISAFVMLVLASLLMVYLARLHIKGQTGDVLGASQQVGEIFFGIGLLLFASIG
ncbi:adenosylcobinamide-GDP ribazoletransferase [uncultured Cohaesibacter sp.]|uniref:adenosylcobinamide-GDP ribazoletransferase n=1 Tax=uncultured Cohaesibacter sp. TaxID=1002546 RepID=UPI0029C93076|nr:adenosylcobinamide-GDP ribazoletransferase [uncultured Cohaesibacter sp.]